MRCIWLTELTQRVNRVSVFNSCTLIFITKNGEIPYRAHAIMANKKKEKSNEHLAQLQAH